tara:strand:- start:844 stop:1575 length:732 start_codon:yes stop_codon:yes gene_type:complete
MAVSVDTVYQTVLALANKEQRGYITPQEFNLFANHAQQDIFEQYFYDLNQFKRVPGNNDTETDVVTLIEDKISLFSTNATLFTSSDDGVNSKFELPEDNTMVNTTNSFYRLVDIRTSGGVIVNKLSRKDFWLANQSPLTRGSNARPNFYIQQNNIWVNAPTMVNKIVVNYIRKPLLPKWGYVVVGGSAMYNSDGGTQDFELHPSEEQNLVIKIAKLAGIAIKDAGLAQAAAQQEVSNIQQEKA